MAIKDIIERTIGKEGGYSDHPSDKGGPTRWGITQDTARRNGYTGDMKVLPRVTAVAIYTHEYMLRPGFAYIEAISAKVAEELFDSGVNFGPAVPSLWLQMALNSFNKQATLYPDIGEDGDIGPGTIRTFKAYMEVRGADAESVMLKALNCLQGARYIDLGRKRGKNEDFTFGWIRTRVEL